MAITVDDGTFATGNSFVTADEADVFHLDRGNGDWGDADTDVKDAALIRAFDFLSVQAWKSDAFTSDIPQRIKNAQCVAALKELIESGSIQPDVQTGVKKETIDDVVSMEYFEGGDNSGVIFTAIENLIKPYLYTSNSRRRLVRGGGAAS